jgi:putative endonuclease
LTRRSSFGKWGEDKAAEYLTKQGYAIIERNYRCRFGEIDIIAVKEGALTFVEVKTRANLKFGRPAASVTKTKQNKIHSTGFHYLSSCNIKYRGFYFDVIEVLRMNGETKLTHLKHCF